MSQCPTCGRVSEDWSERDGGTKGRQRTDQQNRAARYLEWRHGLGDGCYTCDVDQVEWRSVNGALAPVATIELTKVDGNMKPPSTYFEAILSRFRERDLQGQHSLHVAERLGVSCFIVAFRWDLSEFWVFNLSADRGWWHLTRQRYEKWLRSLKGGANESY